LQLENVVFASVKEKFVTFEKLFVTHGHFLVSRKKSCNSNGFICKSLFQG